MLNNNCNNKKNQDHSKVKKSSNDKNKKTINDFNTFLSRSGYSIKKTFLTSKQIKSIKKDLTVCPIVDMNYGQTPSPFLLYQESPKRLYVPRYYGIKKFGQPEYDKLKKKKKFNQISTPFNGTMRDKQIPVVQAFLDECQKSTGGIICLPCGFGKTIIALNILSKLQKKTLVVCHKEFLLNQWKDKIKIFLPQAQIGLIQQKKIQTENKDIVLGMLQSIAMRDYPNDLFNQFDFVIFDECHHLGAEVFSRALAKLTTTYMLGLSATPDRKDGLSKVFEFYLGDMIYCIKVREPDTVSLKIIKYFSTNPIYCKPIVNNFTGVLNSPSMITKICNYQPRSDIIIDEVKKMVNNKRRILILSERRAHLDYFYKQIIDQNIATCGYYVGGMKQMELDESAKKQIVLGTFHLASEGMDVPTLNTVILASPKTDIKQSIGRIFRQKAGERSHDPLILDIIDENIPSFKRKFTHRNKIYRQNKYSVSKVKVYDGNQNNQNIVEQLNYDFQKVPLLIE